MTTTMHPHPAPGPWPAAATARSPGRLTAWIVRFQRRLSGRVHASGDAAARAHGWAVTPTVGRFGFGGRRYRDPRFTQHHAAAAGQSRGPRNRGPGPERRNTDA
jgi:hypothetical protein